MKKYYIINMDLKKLVRNFLENLEHVQNNQCI